MIVQDEMKEDSDDVEVTENVENVIGLLLNSLSENSTVVRWNAAKQLGRVAERLQHLLLLTKERFFDSKTSVVQKIKWIDI